MALLNRTLRKGSDYPKQICFLEDVDCDDAKIINIQNLGLPVIGPETNNNEHTLVPLSRTIYVLKEFENNPVVEILEKTPNVIIMGVTAVAEFVLNSSLEFRTKPLFCTSMNGMCFYIDRLYLGFSTATRMVTLIKWMGGYFCRKPNGQTTHMVTTSVLSDEYIYCSTFKVSVVTPEWIEECWKNKELVGNIAHWSENEYCVKPFQGLFICMRGFDKLEKMNSIVEENGGTVVPIEHEDCTHLVIPDTLIKHINIEDIPFHIVFVVSEQWFINSIEHNCRLYEERFSCYKPAAILKTPRCKKKETTILEESEDTEESLASDGFQVQAVQNAEEDETKKKEDKKALEERKMYEKKKFIYKELCETERSYLRSLRCLVELYHRSTKPGSRKGPVLSQIQAKIIFANLVTIYEIHRLISEQLDSGLPTWETNTPEGSVKALQVFLDLKKQLTKEYVIYSDNFEEHSKMFKQCEEGNSGFKQLMKTLKNDIKGDYRSLFIRPVQRMPSVLLLIKELDKTTPEESPEKQIIVDVVGIVGDILQMMNDTRAETKEREQIFELYHQIEDCPANLIAHHRKYVDQILVSEITNKSQSSGATLTLFVFNDVIEVAKVKSKETSKHWNKSENSSSQKPYKHMELIPLSSITHILVFEKQEGNSEIFGFNLKEKESSKKKIYCFFYLDDESAFETKVQTISKHLYTNNGAWDQKPQEDFILRNIPPKRLSIDTIRRPSYKTRPCDMKNIAGKGVRSAKKNSPNKKCRRRSSSCGKLSSMRLAL